MNLRKLCNALLDRYNEIIEIHNESGFGVIWSGDAVEYENIALARYIYIPCEPEELEEYNSQYINCFAQDIDAVQINTANVYSISEYSLSILHEIGHLKTTTVRLLKKYHGDVLKTRELKGRERRIAYRQIEAEYLADEWALNEINTNLEWLLQLEEECGVNE